MEPERRSLGVVCVCGVCMWCGERERVVVVVVVGADRVGASEMGRPSERVGVSEGVCGGVGWVEPKYLVC